MCKYECCLDHHELPQTIDQYHCLYKQEKLFLISLSFLEFIA